MKGHLVLEKNARETGHSGLKDVHSSLREKLEALEQKLHIEINKEASTREADVYELRELVGGEKLARQEHHSSVQEIIASERREREKHAGQVHEHLADEKATRDVHHASVDERLAALEQNVSREVNTREADVYELRELIGGEKLAR